MVKISIKDHDVVLYETSVPSILKEGDILCVQVREIDLNRKIDGVSIRADTMGGCPCITGRRITIDSLLASIANGMSTAEFADMYEIDEIKVKNCLHGIAKHFGQHARFYQK